MLSQNLIYPLFAVVILVACLLTTASAVGTPGYYHLLVSWHLATVLPAFVAGTWLLIKRKGTLLHKMLGRVYMLGMLLTAIITLMMPARIGPTLLGHFGFIHLFSVLAIYSVTDAWFAIRCGDIKRHARDMIGLYVGGGLIAGSLAFMPGRVLHVWFVGIVGN